MILEDPLHGKVKVEEPVLVDLIESPPVQRLKGVNQAGPAKYVAEKSVTRFDHSVGVMLLLREFGADLEEQVAGLLHDVSHTAFSHVADFLFEDEDHEYHDEIHERVVRDSKIPAIMDSHGLEPGRVLDEENFPLLERDLPDLCADRIDYFLRDWHNGTGEVLERFLDSLSVDGGRFVLEGRDTGEEYALKYIEADERWWASPREVAAFELFRRALQRALDTGAMTEEDLMGTDEEVERKLEASGDDEIERLLRLLGPELQVELDGSDPDLVAETKLRYVDPVVVSRGETLRVTEYSERVRKRIEEHREFVEGGFPIKLV